MSNGIELRQSEEKAITMLAAQRQLYKDAKRLDTIIVMLSVWLPFVISLILLFLPAESNLKIVSYILAIVSMVFSFAFDNIIDKKKELAAYIQQKFDTYVYKMPWNERIFGNNRNVNKDIALYSKHIMEDAREKQLLYNWYTPAVDNEDLLTGILLCQRENVCWDVGLRKRYRLVCVIIIGLLCMIVLVMGLWKNESVAILLCRLAFIIPMLKWLFDTVKSLNKDMKRLIDLDVIVNDDAPKTMDELQDIQRIIMEHRKKCYAIPGFIYQVFKDNDEDMARRVISIDK